MINFDQLLSSLDNIIVVYDENNEILYCNKPLLKKNFQSDHIDLTQEQESILIEDRQYRIIRKKVHMNEQDYRMEIYTDITNQPKNSLACLDDLTGLLNKRSLYNELEKRKSNCATCHEQIVLAFSDIDHFKDINDTIGHIEADKILKHIGKLFQDNLREKDLAARFGGEEFLLVLSACTVEEGYERIEKIRKIFEKQVYFCKKLDGKSYQFHVTLSFGISSCMGKKSIEQIMKEADAALYHSKQHGRNQTTIYHTEM